MTSNIIWIVPEENHHKYFKSVDANLFHDLNQGLQVARYLQLDLIIIDITLVIPQQVEILNLEPFDVKFVFDDEDQLTDFPPDIAASSYTDLVPTYSKDIDDLTDITSLIDLVDLINLEVSKSGAAFLNDLITKLNVREAGLLDHSNNLIYQDPDGQTSEHYDAIANDLHIDTFPVLPLKLTSPQLSLPTTENNEYLFVRIPSLGLLWIGDTHLGFDHRLLLREFARHLILKSASDFSSHQEIQVIEGWKQFLNANDFNTLAELLRANAANLNGIEDVIVWLQEETISSNGEGLVVGLNTNLQTMVKDELISLNFFNQFLSRFNISLDPFWINSNEFDQELNQYLKILFPKNEAVVVLPIVDSARICGLMMVSTNSPQSPIVKQSINLLEYLSSFAGHSIEQMTFVQIMHEKSRLLEATLRSISEGAFFVNEDHRVMFINPQFTELTGINRGEVLHNDSDLLLQRLATIGDKPDDILSQLRDAVGNLYFSSDYPVIEVISANKNGFYVELVIIDRLNDGRMSWVGIVRNARRIVINDTSPVTSLFAELKEHVRLAQHQMQVRLDEASRSMRHPSIVALQNDYNNLVQLWMLDTDLQQLTSTGHGTLLEQVPVQELMEDALNQRLLKPYRQRVTLQYDEGDPIVTVDFTATKRAILYILLRLFNQSPAHSETIIRVEPQVSNEVFIRFSNFGANFSPDEIYKASAELRPTQIRGDQIWLYVSQLLISRNHGDLSIERSPASRHFSIILNLPAFIQQSLEEPDSHTGTNQLIEHSMPGVVRHVIVAQHESVLLQTCINWMKSQGIQVRIYDDKESFLWALDTANFDLAIIDATFPNDVRLVQEIHNYKRLPVVMIADKFNVQQKIDALHYKVDGYWALPLSEAEFWAELNSLMGRWSQSDTRLEPIQIRDLYIDLNRHEVFLRDKLLDLTRIEYDLLCYMARHEGQVLRHEQLLTHVWGPEYRDEKQYLWVNMSRLRKKIQSQRNSPRYIHTRSGVGYYLRRPD
ncbi:hypothetical protein MASR2M15_15720 [Anaerolineales bacterium]